MKTVTIELYDNGSFNVKHDGKETEELTYGEMLEVVSCLTVPVNRRCLEWLRTPEQWAAWRQRLRRQVTKDRFHNS